MGVIFKKSKIVLGDMASFSVWQLMYCCVSVVIRFGTGLVLGSWCGSSGVWVGRGFYGCWGFQKSVEDYAGEYGVFII